MFPEEERDAISKTLQDTIQQNAPSALEEHVSDSVKAYKVSKEEKLEVFCLLEIHRDRLEVQFPDCPSVVQSDHRFEPVKGTNGCRLIVRRRADIPGELLNAAIKAAAGVA